MGGQGPLHRVRALRGGVSAAPHRARPQAPGGPCSLQKRGQGRSGQEDLLCRLHRVQEVREGLRGRRHPCRGQPCIRDRQQVHRLRQLHRGLPHRCDSQGGSGYIKEKGNGRGRKKGNLITYNGAPHLVQNCLPGFTTSPQVLQKFASFFLGTSGSTGATGASVTAASSHERNIPCMPCLLYTSDAADDLLCVDLGGRRIIKKK